MTREELIEVMARAILRDYEDGADMSTHPVPERAATRHAVAALSAIEAAGVRLVPAQLNSKNLEHWKIASAGINAIEDYGGQFGCDHTPERQIADAYRDMVQIAASPYASPGG